MITEEQLELVLAAAERRSSELLEQIYKYKNLGFRDVAEETTTDYFNPLREAIKALRAADIPVAH